MDSATKRPLYLRFRLLPTFVWRAMKEAHAIVYALIATVTWTVGNYAVPWFLRACGMSVTGFSIPVVLYVSVLLLLSILGLGGYLAWEAEYVQNIAALRLTLNKILPVFSHRGWETSISARTQLCVG